VFAKKRFGLAYLGLAAVMEQGTHKISDFHLYRYRGTSYTSSFTRGPNGNIGNGSWLPSRLHGFQAASLEAASLALQALGIRDPIL